MLLWEVLLTAQMLEGLLVMSGCRASYTWMLQNSVQWHCRIILSLTAYFSPECFYSIGKCRKSRLTTEAPLQCFQRQCCIVLPSRMWFLTESFHSYFLGLWSDVSPLGLTDGALLQCIQRQRCVVFPGIMLAHPTLCIHPIRALCLVCL